MKVLVLGVTGFIGWPTAQALSRAGHTVYGLIRKESQVQALKAAEIIPVLGEASKPNVWISIIRSIDVVVECIGGPQILDVGPSVYEAITAAARNLRPDSIPKLTYVYTSGCWVHGDDRVNLVSDTSPLSIAPSLVAWRQEFDQKIIENEVLNGIVVRPGMLYGYSGSLSASLFEKAETGKVEWYGKPGGRVSFIHPDDLADLYVKVVEKALLVGGMVFDAANDQTEGLDDIFERIFVLAGVKGSVTYAEPSNDWERALASTVLMRPYLAKTLLGWQPKKLGFGDGLSIYYEAWKTSGRQLSGLFG